MPEQSEADRSAEAAWVKKKQEWRSALLAGVVVVILFIWWQASQGGASERPSLTWKDRQQMLEHRASLKREGGAINRIEMWEIDVQLQSGHR